MPRSFFGSVRSKLSSSPSTSKRATELTPDQLKDLTFDHVFPNARRAHDPSSANSKQAASAMANKEQLSDNSFPVSDQPPPYSPTDAAAARAPSSRRAAAATRDTDPYAFLANFDTIFLIDDSGSMADRGRWREAERALRAITPICTARDSDGVDIYFLNHRPNNYFVTTPEGKADGGYYGVTSASVVSDIFAHAQPSGATPTGQRLRQILKPYVRRLEQASDPDAVKPINVIVITDGRATDEPEEVLVNAAGKLDRLDAAPSQVGVQFFQIGEDDDAADALRYLDDDLKGRGVRDMVDTCTWNDAKAGVRSGATLTSDVILKVVLGAVLRRLDNQPAGRTRR